MANAIHGENAPLVPQYDVLKIADSLDARFRGRLVRGHAISLKVRGEGALNQCLSHTRCILNAASSAILYLIGCLIASAIMSAHEHSRTRMGADEQN
jgi:hypothetical protein